jgi:hypothetical protein
MAGVKRVVRVSWKSWRAAVLSVGRGGEAMRGLELRGVSMGGDERVRLGVLGALGGRGAWGGNCSVISIPNS